LLVGNGTRVPTYRLVVEYDGTAFHGLQFQPVLRTVAGALEDALARLFRAPGKITAAGRTDAGVHASGQVVSFHAERAFPIERLVLALNANTPDDLVVRDAQVVGEGFSARFDARERVYDYLILNRAFPSALWRARAGHGGTAGERRGEVLGGLTKGLPTLRIREVVVAMLDRNGEVVAAAAETYRRQLETYPHLAELMTQGGRGREVAAARGAYERP